MFDLANYQKGSKYVIKGNYDKGLIFLKRAFNGGEFKELLINTANAYKALGQWKVAEKLYVRAMDRNTPFHNAEFGEYDLAYSNYGLLQYAQGNDDEAIKYYRKALDINPKLADAVWNYSSALLRKYCSGQEVDLSAAWDMYEFRFKRSSPVGIDSSLPRWDEKSKVQNLVVLSEQGFGDKIMFGRYISRLREYCDEVYVQCHPTMDSIFSDFKIVRSANEVDGHSVPICSLARVFKDTGNGEWLRGKFEVESLGERWLGENPRVAVEWAGSPTHANNLNRSINADRFLKLRNSADLYSFRSTGVPKGIKALGSVGDWGLTASYLLDMDLLITVDTSVAHMAGSLGVKTWLLQPCFETDFRWGHGGQSIWYPSVTVFQNNGWDKLFIEVERELEKFSAEYKETMIKEFCSCLEA